MTKDAATLAQEQLEAYNQGDIEAFLKAYSPQVEAYDLERGELLFKGLNAMADRYGPYFKANPNLHCQLVGRLHMGTFCVDQEIVTGLSTGHEVKAIAIYQTNGEHITRIWFLKS